MANNNFTYEVPEGATEQALRRYTSWLDSAKLDAKDHQLDGMQFCMDRELATTTPCGAKGGIIAFTKSLAREMTRNKINVNCVCPGPVRTKLAMAVHSQAIIDAYHDAIPLNRYGSENEIAEVIVFLCSGKASYVTGQVVAADGGFESTGVGLPALRD